MSCRMTWGKGETTFVEEAQPAWREREGWYEAHPTATFEEGKEATRQRRQGRLSKGLELLVNGRQTGSRVVECVEH